MSDANGTYCMLIMMLPGTYGVEQASKSHTLLVDEPMVVGIAREKMNQWPTDGMRCQGTAPNSRVHSLHKLVACLSSLTRSMTGHTKTLRMNQPEHTGVASSMLSSGEIAQISGPANKNQ